MSIWLGVAALVLVALVFLWIPLRRTAGGKRWPVFGLLGGLPALTVGLYLYLGAPEIIEAQALIKAQSQYDADAMLTALENKLKKEPEDAEGWYALGRAYIAMQRIPDAEAALSKAFQLAPREARMLSQYAEALALTSGSLEGRPLELVLQALELDYGEEKALELAGLAAYQRGDWAQSLHFWRRLMKRLPKESELYEDIGQAVKIAEGKAAEASGLGDRARLEAPEKVKKPH